MSGTERLRQVVRAQCRQRSVDSSGVTEAVPRTWSELRHGRCVCGGSGGDHPSSLNYPASGQFYGLSKPTDRRASRAS